MATLQTLDRGLEVLDFASQSADGVSVAEVAEHLGVHRAIAHRLVATLAGRGLLGGAGDEAPNPLTAADRGPLVRLVGAVLVGCLVAVGVAAAVSGGFTTTTFIDALSYIALAAPVATFWVMFRSPKVTHAERTRLRAYIPLFVAAMLFWMIFEQAASKMAAFAAERTDLGSIFGITVSAEFFQSVNPLFVVALAPVFAAIWLRRAGKFPSTGAKFAFGVLMAGLSFVLLSFYSHLWPHGPTAPMWALASVFVVQTVGELCLSPVGISATTKLAPAAFTTQAMALWFLTSAVGQSAAAQAIRLMDGLGDTTFFLTLGLITAGFSLVLMALVPWIGRHMRDVEAVKTA